MDENTKNENLNKLIINGKHGSEHAWCELPCLAVYNKLVILQCRMIHNR